MTYPNNANQYLPGTIYIPSNLEITAITRAQKMVVTVSVDAITAADTYIAGQQVKLTIPYLYGMQQAAGMVGTILERVGSTMVLDIDSRNFDPFAIPSSGPKPASLSPYGSRNLQFSNDTAQVPFQTYNNIGN